MTIKEYPEYVPRTYLSVSTLVRFARCKRLYFYEKSGLRRGSIALNPEWGTGMHFAVPVALDTENLAKSMEAFLSHWLEIEERCETLGWDMKKHTRATALRALTHFIHTHAGTRSPYKLIDPPDTGLDVEVSEKHSKFEVPWVIDIGLRVPLGGRLDGICEDQTTGETYIWELKTAGRLNEQFWDAHEMYTQNLTYTLVGQTFDIPVAGVMLEGVLCDAKKVHNECRPIPVMQHHLDDVLLWLRNTGQELLDAEDAYAEACDTQQVTEGMAAEAGLHPSQLAKPEDAFPKDFTGCTGYTHYYIPGFRCEFADLCRVADWRALADLYDLVPDHKLFDLTVDPDAKRTAEQANQTAE